MCLRAISSIYLGDTVKVRYWPCSSIEGNYGPPNGTEQNSLFEEYRVMKAEL